MRRDRTGNPIMIIAILITIIAIVNGYVANKDFQEATQNMAETNKKLEKFRQDKEKFHRINEELSQSLGWREKGYYTNLQLFRDSLDESFEVMKSFTEIYPQWKEKLFMTTQGQVQIDSIGSWKKREEDRTTAALTLNLAFIAFENLNKHLKDEITATENDQAQHYSGEMNLIGYSDEQEGEFIRAEKEGRKNIEEAHKNIQGIHSGLTLEHKKNLNDISNMEQEIKIEIEKLLELRIQNRKELEIWGKKVSDLRNRVEKIQSRGQIEKSTEEADGRILFINNELNFGFIDVGKKNTLLNGTVFNVYSLKKGKKIPKGEVEVRDVMNEMSKISVTRLINPEIQIENGDYIANDIFDRNKKRFFAVAGKLRGKYSLDELTEKIKQIGGEILDHVSIETSYLIAGDGYQDEPSFNEAKELGIKIIREKDLYDLLGIE
jgi:NAD-dependent DNA ligase